MRRIRAIFQLTVREVLAGRLIPAFGILFGVFFLGFALLDMFRPEEQVQFLQDLGITLFSFFAFMITLFGSSVVFDSSPRDASTAFFLAKPIYRSEYLLGRLLGMQAVLWACLAAMGALLVLFLEGKFDIATGQMIAVLYLLGLKYGLFLLVVAFLASWLDRFMTIFTGTFLFFFANMLPYLESACLRNSGKGLSAALLQMGSVILPPFEMLSRTDVLGGESVLSGIYLAKASAVSGFYALAVFLLMWLVFSRKEI